MQKIINNIQYSVAGVIFNLKNQVLMLNRQGEPWETGWECVKGTMHVDEIEEEALLREIDEEVGIQVEIVGRLPKIYWAEKPFQGRTLKIHGTIFVCKYISGEVRLGDEHVAYKWMSAEEAAAQIWLQNGAEFIEKAFELYKTK